MSPYSGTRALVRVGAHLSSPLRLAGAVLLLVASLGAFSTYSTYRALCRAGEERASDALRMRMVQLQGSLGEALAVADVLLERLAGEVRGTARSDPAALLAPLRALATARPGLTWISASFPDGTFVGVYVDDHGTLRGQISETRGEGGERRTYDFDRDGAPHEIARAPSQYDPRARDFYRTALTRKTRTWTAPYPFLPRYRTGVSRVEPLYRGAARTETLEAVLTVDFDASGLSDLMDAPLTPHQRQLVLAGDGAILAASGLALPAPAQWPHARSLRVADVADAVLTAARARVPLDGRAGARSFEVAGETWRLEQVRALELEGAPVALVDLIPERELFADAHREALRGLASTGLGALLGVALSLVLAQNIARLRRKRVEAEREAERAREQVAELGSYRLLAPIGKGGMGEVYRARHTLLARDAALKLIRPSESDEADEGARSAQFFEEARVLASLRSVHTVAVYDFGRAEDGRYFLAMELLDGLDLDALVRQHGPQPPARVAQLLAQACDSLAEAHAAGLVHRDIKPANLFLCHLAGWLDVLKVLDFGLTRAVGSNQDGRAAIEGTPAYMAPEQALGERVGPSSDLYSLGCVGYWLLTGRPPYELDDPDATMEAHVAAPLPELPAAVRAAVPPALVQLITRCMAKLPDHRPTSAAALGAALRRVASECAPTFTESMRAAFWAARQPGELPEGRGERTQPMVAVQHARSIRRAS